MSSFRDVTIGDWLDDNAASFVKITRPVVRYGHGNKESMCEGKKPFTVFSLANVAAGRRKKRQVYRCKFCRSWHVGTRG